MTCYSPELFSPEEADKFISMLFSPAPVCDESLRKNRVHPAASPSTKINKDDQAEIKNYILSLYRQFLSQRDLSRPWYEPLLKFLREYDN
jgi:hypothetical protein